MLKKGLFIVFFGGLMSVNAQVINIESLRNPSDTARFVGKATLDIELTQNVNRELNISNAIALQYSHKKNTFLFINQIEFKNANGENLTNKSVQHLRYNYRFTHKLALESFVQFQKDKVSFINYRALFGLGSRLKLYQSKKGLIHLGTLLMYEYENAIGESRDAIEKNVRGDVYFSFNLNLKKSISLNSTTYYQPRINQFSDYRISSQTTLSVIIIKNLALTTSFSYQFDTMPVFGIPKNQYTLENGISYSF